MTVDEFIAACRTWVGVPFHHQGRNRHGVDCVGLPICVLRDAGALPEGFYSRVDYGRRPSRELDVELRKWCQPIQAARPGCLAVIKWPREAAVSHVAVCTGATIIHSYARAGAVVEQPFRGAVEKWTKGFYLVPGVTYE